MIAPKLFAVVVDGRRRAMPWGRFETRQEAEKTAKRLRLHGFVARVCGPDDLELEEAEHQGDRRRFLAWCVMAGFVKPQRLTERVLEEIEGAQS